MNLYNLLRLTTVLLLSSLSITSNATGASSAQIDIEPVTYNDNGDILFKAFKQIDYTGAASGQKFSYWWIVITSKKRWEEKLHVLIVQPDSSTSDKPDAVKDLAFKKYVDMRRYYSDEFDNGFDWASPPATILPLIAKYKFKLDPNFDKNEGHGSVTWSSKKICLRDKCSRKSVPQRTLNSKTSSHAYSNIEFKDAVMHDIELPPVTSIFYHAGIALFRNGNYEIVDGKYEVSDIKELGASFDFNVSEKNGEMIDYNYIDAIAIIPNEILEKQ